MTIKNINSLHNKNHSDYLMYIKKKPFKFTKLNKDEEESLYEL